MRFPVTSAALSILLLGGVAALRGQPAPVCRAVQLEPFLQDDECGMGRCYTGLDLRNVSAAACTLPGSSHVTALDKQGAVIRVERLAGDPVVLAPGEFGEYQSESYSKDVFPHRPVAAATYLFRLAAGDPGALRFPGNQSLSEGPSKPYENYPVPNLSGTPQATSKEFAFSAFRWPVAQPPEGGDARLLDSDDPSLGLHVSVANHSTADRPGWNRCRVVVVTAEDGVAGSARRSQSACTWNGDIAHGAIAAGATVAFETEARLPRVCRRARYAISVSLEDAPVTFAPIVLHTEQFQPLCSDSKVSQMQAAPAIETPGLHSRDVQWGLPVSGLRLGLDIPVRRYLYNVIAIDEPGDRVVAGIWVDNARDTPLHLAGPHGFHLRILNGTPPGGSRLSVELKPARRSDDTGPLDVTVPPHTEMRVATVDLGADYDFALGPAPRQEYLVGIYSDALTGDDARWNWVTDGKSVWSLKALTSFRVEPPGVSK